MPALIAYLADAAKQQGLGRIYRIAKPRAQGIDLQADQLMRRQGTKPPVRLGLATRSADRIVQKHVRHASDAHHKADRGGRAAADVEGGEVLRSLDLIVSGIARHLPPGIERHADAGCAYRMAKPDQST